MELFNKPTHPLLDKPIEGTTVLTLEHYEKWYNMYLLYPNGSTMQVPRAMMLQVSGEDQLYIDHCFHPVLLLRLARSYNAAVSPTTLEIAAGRWIMEGKPLTVPFSYFIEDDEDE